MIVPNWKTNKGQKFSLYLKSMEAIRDISGHPLEHDYSQKRTKIIHSSGDGGGLPLKQYFIDKYAGTGCLLTVKFHRMTNHRFLFETIHPYAGPTVILYGEWLNETPNQFLDDKLFEI